MSEDYATFKDRAEHDFVKSITVDLAKIDLLVSDIRKRTDLYINSTMPLKRAEDDK